jgi:hypothetical protein
MSGQVGQAPVIDVAGSAVLPHETNLANSPMTTPPVKQVVATETLDSDLDLSNFPLSENSSGDGVQKAPPGSNEFETTVPMTPDGEDLDVAAHTGLNVQTGPSSVMSQSINPQTSLPPGGHTGSLQPENGMGRGEGSVSDLISPGPGLPPGTEIRSVAPVTFDHYAPFATDPVDDVEPNQGIDPAEEALVTIEDANPKTDASALPSAETTAHSTVDRTGQDDRDETDIGPDRIDASNNEGPAAPRPESIVAAASPGQTVPGDLEPGAVDFLLDSAGLWHRRPAPRDHVPAVISKPYPRFSLDANPLTRSNPPRKEP